MNAQPIATVVTSTEAAYAGESQQQNQKPRFSRAEKREFARQKKAAEAPQQSKKHSRAASQKVSHKKHGDAGVPGFNDQQIDEMIVRLLSIRGKGKDAKALETRITRDAPKNEKKKEKELSPKKLEKLQKRREIRAERKKAWLAKKEAEKAGGAEGAPAPAPFPTLVQQQPLPYSDEINFDEL
ncbi:hypothetical protein BU26DRAFT_521882 [Trematosphaeria pertusa]|uniref:Uncharacterized protein n=1 Tax=Trematosphaeria pertusa TaxID=390896 RepID=A0A6A6I7B9_9PLEO|nr:uncharacterized protein BU26DRAFT_521882 [Trematosphaeria pertusa]KAF2245433.1 hypothetical protein BU26DRAFT_521882 [Trematosphaeria pertusa]